MGTSIKAAACSVLCLTLVGAENVVLAPTTGGQASTVKVAFGSCSRPDQRTKVWDSVARFKPDVWLWLGDTVYLDKKGVGFLGLKNAERKYAQTKAQPAYQRAIQGAKVMGTWDDHDMGRDNAGSSFPDKHRTKELALDFLSVPRSDPVWGRESMFSARVVEKDGRRIKFILLDTRWFKTETQLLGPEQWGWLREEVGEEGAAGISLFVVVSSIQITHDWGESFAVLKRMERWGTYPDELRELLALTQAVTRTQGKPFVFLSGDVHHGDLRIIPSGCSYAQRSFQDMPVDLDAPIVEGTSSGITHAVLTRAPPFYPGLFWTWLLRGWNVRTVAFAEEMQRDVYLHKNFGAMVVDFATGTVRLEIRDEDGEPVLQQVHSFAELTGGRHAGDGNTGSNENNANADSKNRSNNNNNDDVGTKNHKRGLLPACPVEWTHPAPHPYVSLAGFVTLYIAIELSVLVLPLYLVYRHVVKPLHRRIARRLPWYSKTKRVD
ncbi:alkaline phosphatase [Diplonema papillatum]|nr:alkaline phosphatase [Diplonema papillatum]